MRKRTAFVVAAVLGSIGFGPKVEAEEFKKLSGAQIRAKLAGMQFTDESHWDEVYWPDSRFTSDEMGRKRIGRWRIERNQLCRGYAKDGENACYEVWLSGQKMQLRTAGSADLHLEGVLEKRSNRR